jgi:hypothetical protein
VTRYTILYRSGAKVTVKAEGLKVQKRGSEVLSVTWDKISPRPYVLGVDDIVAIFEGRA